MCCCCCCCFQLKKALIGVCEWPILRRQEYVCMYHFGIVQYCKKSKVNPEATHEWRMKLSCLLARSTTGSFIPFEKDSLMGGLYHLALPHYCIPLWITDAPIESNYLSSTIRTLLTKRSDDRWTIMDLSSSLYLSWVINFTQNCLCTWMNQRRP